MEFDVTGSIVTYKNDLNILKRAIESFLSSKLNVRLYIFDNSPTREVESICLDERIEYIFNDGANVGFGAGHNFILTNENKLGNYHIVINPDIRFDAVVVEELKKFMENNPLCGLVMPDVLYPNGERQYLPKLLPSPFNLFIRRFNFSKILRGKANFIYEMQFADYSRPFEVAIVSGCFSFFRKSALLESSYDESFFMYFEDFDLSRRIICNWKLMCYPRVHVYHEYGRGSHKNNKLFKIFLKSLVTYFNKHGWLFDEEKKAINGRILESYGMEKG